MKTITINFALFLFATLFSYLGDVIAVVAIPLLLLKKSGSIAYASVFSILVLTSCLLVAGPSAAALKRFHPMKIVLCSDLVAGLLLIYLANQEDILNSDPNIFLGICFILAVIINFPMFIKSQVFYQYYIQPKDLSRLSVFQGKLMGLVFILAAVTVSVGFEYFGFRNLMIFDSFTYIPLLALCWLARNSKTLGYDPAKANEIQSRPKPTRDQTMNILLYYFLNMASYLFSNFRAHLSLALLLSLYQEFDLKIIGLSLALGTAASLISFGKIDRLFTSSVPRSILVVSVLTALTGAILTFKKSYVVVAAVGYLLTEINALILASQRKKQTEIRPYHSQESMSKWAAASGSLLSAVLIYGLTATIHSRGPLPAFLGLSALIATGLLICRRTHSRSMAFLLIMFCSNAFHTDVAAAGFEYKTVMLDRPRLFGQLGANTMSEDERFIMNNVYCGLFRTDILNGTIPDLVASWTVENQGLDYQFTIRDGAMDSDGKKIDSNYVYKSLIETLRTSAKEAHWSNPTPDSRGYLDIAGFRECITGDCSLNGVSLHGNEVRIRLLRKRQNFTDLLAAHILPIHSSRRLSDGSLVPISCGPYKVREYSQKNLILVQNPNATLEPGSPDSFHVSFESPTEATKGFCNGTFNDLVFLVPTKQSLDESGCSPGSFVWRESDTAGYWAINLSTPHLLKDRALHARISQALDVDDFRRIWTISSRAQNSMIPYGFEQPVTSTKMDPRNQSRSTKPMIRSGRKLTVRYIDGTPEPIRLENAIATWMKKTGLSYEIIPTQFTAFMKDLTAGKSDVYIYAELATSKLHNFLSPIYQMNAQHYTGADLKSLNTLWNDFNSQNSRSNLSELDGILLRSKRFVPLFIFRRPLVFKKGYFLRQHSTLGLATLPIQEFRRGSPL